jgi:hypothetical protein
MPEIRATQGFPLFSLSEVNLHQPTSTNSLLVYNDGISGSIMLVPQEGISMALTDIKVRTAKPTDKQITDRWQRYAPACPS